MKQVLISLTFLLVILSACNHEQTENNYYFSLSGESDHWKLAGYEIVMLDEEYKAGYGRLSMKGENKHMADFFSFSVYAVVDGAERSLHSGSVSGEADIANQRTGTIESEGENIMQFCEIDQIYMVVSWNDDETEGDQEERIVLYNKDKNGETFLNAE
ncbi:hypothetical protein BN1058_01083 [Paraliobacillus sp. PM-2]|uniref:hypothetical protein n=1 Tax=Paraliobacillus sp. PM-2 TaxID=1462524 RepID=UPI00061C8ED2|nr:hypothetical protein [Paraliobacillus sp. PM-2]CQR46808.1 hypothetical protein BN1058_01083 [Paraliobacillus sp. PM-2]